MGIIKYDSVILDRYGNFNKDTGIFKAPKDGLYVFFFSCSLLAQADGAIYVQINGAIKQYIIANNRISTAVKSAENSAYWSLNLKKYDEVSLYNTEPASLMVGWSNPLDFMGMAVQ